jgi:deoxyribonuclease-4
MNPIGAHMSIAGGLAKALERIQAVGGECLQIFVKPNVQWRAGELSLEEVQSFKDRQQQSGITPVVAHASYLLNLASPEKELRRRSVLTLALELVRAARLNIEFLILHPGSHRESGEKKGLEQIAKGIDQALDRAEVLQTKILLETTAGSGSHLGGRLEHLENILALSRSIKRLGVCLDTSHVLAAGYNIADPQGYDEFFRSFQKLIGLKHLRCVHVNDSKAALGSRVDRHEHIGHGHLGLKTFERLFQDPRLTGIPFILETPKGEKEDQDWDYLNIEVLKKLRQAAVPQKGRPHQPGALLVKNTQKQ